MADSLEDRLSKIPNPSWSYKTDPDLPDLEEIMSDWESGVWANRRGPSSYLNSHKNKEEFLAKIERRWRDLQAKAGNTRRMDSPLERDRRMRESALNLKAIMDRIKKSNPHWTTLTTQKTRSTLCDVTIATFNLAWQSFKGGCRRANWLRTQLASRLYRYLQLKSPVTLSAGLPLGLQCSKEVWT
jgi:hypothetical protein